MIQALERPATTASATKSCSLMASVSARICRAKRGQSRSAMTRMTLRKLGSDTATRTTAMRMVGNDSPTSVSRMRTASVTPPGNQGSPRLSAGMADPRVQIAIQQVHEEIPGEVEGTQHQDPGLHDRIVARGDAFEEQSSQARPGEYGLGNHRASQELHEEHDGEGDDRQQRVLQAVLPQDDLFMQPLESRELD